MIVNESVLYKISSKPTGKTIESKPVNTSEESANLFRDIFPNVGLFELFYVVALDIKQKPLAYTQISTGGLTATVVDIRMVAKFAMDNKAHFLLVAHNHPSGTTKPSKADVQLTEKLKTGLNLLDISLLDHIILTESTYVSFLDDGLL